ncbi:MAG: hypothetical protein ACLFUJ_05910 [Phycisphaerae bacterium]
MKPATAEKLLVWLLRIGGLMMLSAIVPMFMPVGWIDQAHRMMGLGPFPTEPVAEYLARLSSGLYAVLGGYQLVLSLDVTRYRPLIVFTAAAVAILTLSGNILGALAGMPWWWVVGDIGTALPYCGLLAYLAVRGRPEVSAAD